MTKTFKRTAIISAVLISLAAIPAVAAPWGNSRDSNDRYDDERPRMNRSYAGNEECPMDGAGYGFMFRQSAEEVLMGTVTSIDESKGLIQLENVDGTTVTVHVNPETMIVELRNNEASGRKYFNRRGPDFVEASKIKKGSWIAVRTFKTDTKVQEAALIQIQLEK
jgi:hypothetical protein